MVEQQAHNLCCVGSNPSGSIILLFIVESVGYNRLATIRRYISYECRHCGYKCKYLLYEDPKYGPCPKCNKFNAFYKKEVEKKIKRSKIKRKR